MTIKPISCAFGHLYPDNAGFPEPELLQASDLASDVAGDHGIDLIAEVFPVQAYGSAFTPDIFVKRTPDTDAMEPLYRDIAIKAASPVALVRLARAVTVGSIAYADVDDLRVIYETQRSNDRAATLPPSLEKLRKATPFPAEPAIDYLFLASAGSSNYGHTLVDDLPRLKAIDYLRRMWPSRRQGVVMPAQGAAADKVRAEAVTAICKGEVSVHFIEADRAYSFQNLFYVSPCSFHPVAKNPHAIRYLQSALRPLLGDVSGGDRLFVNRPAGDSRQILNGHDIGQYLKHRGYRQVHPERLSFVEQARLFAGADRIVGQMGAAMTNTLFCLPGSDLIYFAPRGWIEPFYWDLSMTADHRYRVLYGATPDGNGRTPHLQDCSIDVADLAASLDG